MPATKKRVTASEVLEQARRLSGGGRDNWLSRLRPSDRDWLVDLRKEYVSRQHERPHMATLFVSVKQHLKLDIHVNTFCNWLKGN